MRPLPPRIDLVALDLDGTVVSPDLQVSPGVLATLARARRSGVATTIVTGRMYRAALPFAQLLQLEGPIICYQGAGIFDTATGAILRHTPLAGAIALEVVAYAKARGLHVQLYADDTFFVEKISEFSALYAYVSGIHPELVPSLELRFAHEDSTKVVLVVDAKNAAQVSDELTSLLGPRAYVTRSNPEFVEVLAPGIDKGEALQFVARHLGIALGATMGVGDSWNDIPLLQGAAFGVAMGSAPPAARASADAVVADVVHDGVCEAFERFVFPQLGETVRG